MHTQILSYIHAVTPRSFLWIYVGVWAVLLLVGYFLAGGFYVFMTAIMLIASIGVIYKYQKPPIVKNNSVFLIPLMGLVYTGIFHSGLLFAPELITDKSQAEQTTGIIPETHEYIRGSGKGAKSRYYLNVNGQRFHCDDDSYDDCKLIYAYKGQTATVWHYEGLAYEIEVGGQKVYEFSAQAQKFKATQDKRLWQLIWSVILFGVPSMVFYFVNKIVIRDLEVVETQSPPKQPQNLTIRSHTGELLVGGHRQVQTKAKLISSRMMAGGHAWRILFGFFGTFSLMLFLVMWVMGAYVKLLLALLLTIGLYYVASLPRKNAKEEVAFYHEMLEAGEDMGELSDYESSGFYNHMGTLSWVMMVVFVALVCLLLWGCILMVGEGVYVMMIIMLVCVLLCLAVMAFIIKQAINIRDMTLE